MDGGHASLARPPDQSARRIPAPACLFDAKRPLGFPAGAIPTVDFLLHDFGAVVKKVGVKTHDRAWGRFTGSNPGLRSASSGLRSLRSGYAALGVTG